MKELTHGGDIYGYQEAFGRNPLDFSANINPLGLPEGVRRAVIDALDSADRYPDPLCRELTRALSIHEQVPEQYILCGNGAADLIFRLALALRPAKVLLPAPTFAEYAQAVESVGAVVHHHVLLEQEEFQITQSILREITPELDLLCLCNPNNPTGQAVQPEMLISILQKCRECSVTVLLDECFLSFLDQPEQYAMKGYLAQFPNLVILKAFTKLYAMAGLRLGYCLCSDSTLLEQMRSVGQPWPVSTLASAAGLAALEEQEYVAQTKALIAAERAFLCQGLTQLGMRVYGSHANYIFFKSPLPSLKERLLPLGVLIRSCGNYPGLDGRFYRIAVRSSEENRAFIQALTQL